MVTFIAVLLALASFNSVPAPQAASAPPRLDTSAWEKYEAPFRLVGPIYYVGTQELAAFLVSSPQGHILIDGGTPGAAAVIEKSIREIGFKPEDIRILLTTQAHYDHVGTHAHFKKLSGAMVQAMAGDETLLRDGGKSDYLFGGSPDSSFPRVAVDRVLKDGDIVTVGGARLTARRTPGHTPGSASYEMAVNEGGRDYKVLFAASTSVNPGTRFVKNPSYPTILEDFRKTFQVLESMQPDIFVSGHASFFNLKAKRAKMNPESPAAAFVDPQGYRTLLAEKKKAFEAAVAKEQAAR